MLIGTIGSPRRAHVKGGGVVVFNPETPDEIQLSWWVGADDRWHVPAREITTRQHLVRNMPIVQTAVRIPSGDAIATCFGAVQGQRELAVLDVENRSKTPFAIAFVLSGPGVRDVTVTGSTVKVGGFPLLHLPRSPQRMTCLAASDSLAALEAHVAEGHAGTTLTTVEGPSVAAFLLPVTHSTSVRVAAMLGASSAVALMGTPVVSALPDVHSAANGWGLQLGRALSVRLPDVAMANRLESLCAALLLAAEPIAAASGQAQPGVAPGTLLAQRATVAEAMDRVGFHAEAGALLDDIGELQGPKGGFAGASADVALTANIISALSIHAGLLSDKVFAETMAPTVGGALEFILRAGKRDAAVRPLASACRAAADLFTAAGDRRAADQARRAWERASSPWPVPSLPLPPLPAFGGGGSLVPDDPQRLAADVRSFVGQLVSMEPDGTIDVLRGFEESWRGQNVEVRNAPTPFGRLSFAIRWHGARPALLWDVVTSETTSETAAERNGTAPVAGTLRLRCSALDPTWTAVGISGEALLAI